MILSTGINEQNKYKNIEVNIYDNSFTYPFFYTGNDTDIKSDENSVSVVSSGSLGSENANISLYNNIFVFEGYDEPKNMFLSSTGARKSMSGNSFTAIGNEFHVNKDGYNDEVFVHAADSNDKYIITGNFNSIRDFNNALERNY